MMILGITGHAVAGKDTVAEYLVKKYGYKFVSTGDLVREEIRASGLGEPTRDLMQRIANELRAKEGPDVLINRGIARHASAERLVFGGIRALAEARAIQERGGKILSINVPVELRFKRSQARGREGDGTTLEEFIEKENREASGVSVSSQNINGIIAQADITIDNSGTFDELYASVDSVVRKLHENPSC